MDNPNYIKQREQGKAESNETPTLSNAERQARFKANQAFKSLPIDVQHSIDRISDSPEEKSRRTANAIDYQRMFPNSLHRGTGL